ncbi:MAG: diaminopimelate epimerase [Actinobacteria bacterium]|nr:diaminopimelate epimerase [Actinomycetota bacterium]
MSVILPFVKGHGTHNDFIVLLDPDNNADLTPEQVRWLCARHSGLGADGVLRVVETQSYAAGRDVCPGARYFMDYRNADGTTAEMCGNGIRVFAHVLVRRGWETNDTFAIGTRGGCMEVTQLGSDRYAVHLPASADPFGDGFDVVVADSTWRGVGVLVPNPHVVALVVDLEALGPLREAPRLDPSPSEGANVEFVELRAPGRIAMRVHERGVGETQSCGTGACAAAWVARLREPARSEWIVEVPGGHLEVMIHGDDSFTLIGPAEIVAEGVVTIP